VPFSFLRCRLQSRYSKVVTVIIVPWCNKDCRRRF
jgi:hypothetical protein